MKRILYLCTAAFTIAALSAASNQVYAERTLAKATADCGNSNWCAGNPIDGDANCNRCCGGTGGLCLDY